MDLLAWAKSKKHLVIYGAGEYAFWISIYFLLCDISWNGYVVSTSDGKRKMFGRPILGLDDSQALLERTDGIVVAVSRQYHRQIQRSIAGIECAKYFITMDFIHRCLDVISYERMDKIAGAVAHYLEGEKTADWIEPYVAYQQGRGLYELYAHISDRQSIGALSTFIRLREKYAGAEQEKLENTVEVFDQRWKIAEVGSFLAQYDQIFVQRIYEFTRDKKVPLHILDCGANIGMSVKFYLEHYPQAKVEAFEADPRIFSFLAENLKDAIRDGRLLLHNQAVWDSETVLSFLQEGDEGGHITKTATEENTVQVKTADIASVLTKYDTIDFWKIDIEGAETRVLTQALPYLKRVKNIFVEYHSMVGEVQTIDKIFQILVGNGFRVFVDSTLIGKNPFLAQDSFNGFDGLVNIYAKRR